jgi:hypothetical protein
VVTSNRNNITTQVMYEANLLPWNVSVVDTREVPTQPAQDIRSTPSIPQRHEDIWSSVLPR